MPSTSSYPNSHEFSKPLPIEHFDVAVPGVIDRAFKGNTPGRIRYSGTTWFARPYINGLDLPLAEGDKALILARQGNTLLIMPTPRHPG
ncbi:MAG: NfeD family protein [Cyanobacteria bacterium J06636_16]